MSTVDAANSMPDLVSSSSSASVNQPRLAEDDDSDESTATTERVRDCPRRGWLAALSEGWRALWWRQGA